MADITKFTARPHQAPLTGCHYDVMVEHNATTLCVSAVEHNGQVDVVSVKREGSTRQIVATSRLREIGKVATLGAIARHKAGSSAVTKGMAK